MVGTYRNKIDKVGKMIFSKFSAKVLAKTIFDINDWDRINVSVQSKLIFIEF